VWIKTGSADESAEQAGISHFLEHLFFKGTETRTARELMDAIESRGGHMNAFTTREHTCLFVKTLKHHGSTAIAILA
ncbi:insulinase family protein, partial [Shewanella sp. C32]